MVQEDNLKDAESTGDKEMGMRWYGKRDLWRVEMSRTKVLNQEKGLNV